jgi:hypothetical protein
MCWMRVLLLHWNSRTSCFCSSRTCIRRSSSSGACGGVAAATGAASELLRLGSADAGRASRGGAGRSSACPVCGRAWGASHCSCGCDDGWCLMRRAFAPVPRMVRSLLGISHCGYVPLCSPRRYECVLAQCDRVCVALCCVY